MSTRRIAGQALMPTAFALCLCIASGPAAIAAESDDRATQREVLMESVLEMGSDARSRMLVYPVEPASADVAVARDRAAQIHAAMEAMNHPLRTTALGSLSEAPRGRALQFDADGEPVAWSPAFESSERAYGSALERFQQVVFSEAEKQQVKDWMLELAPRAIALGQVQWEDRRSYQDRSQTLLGRLGRSLPQVVRDADERLVLCQQIASMRLGVEAPLDAREASEWLSVFGGGSVGALALLPLLELMDDADPACSDTARLAASLGRIARASADNPEGPIPGLVDAVDGLSSGAAAVDFSEAGSWDALGPSTPYLLRARFDAGLYPAEDALAVVNAWWSDPVLWESANKDHLGALNTVWLRDIPTSAGSPRRVIQGARSASDTTEAVAQASLVLPLSLQDLVPPASTPAWFEVQRPSSSSAGE